MRYLTLAFALSLAAACDHVEGRRLAADTGPATPVLVELFTSEGCSSCPPADALLRTLVGRQPVPGVRVIALSEHVEYWNRLGWRDPFSASEFTNRQTEYQAAAFRTSPIYTPQLVVDGALECIGSDEPAVRRALEQAARAAKATVHVTVSEVPPNRASITVDVDIPQALPHDGAADVVVAIAEDGLVTDVRRGENRGRRLAHDAVARVLRVVGTIDEHERTKSVSAVITLSEDWDRRRLSVVAFVQDRGSRAVIGVEAAALTETPGLAVSQDSPDSNQSGHRRQS